MNNIRELIRRSGEKQAAVASELGVSQAAISDWCTEKKNPSIDRLIAFARHFHVSVGCVVGEEPIPPDYPNHFPPARLQDGDPIPAMIGDKPVKKVSVFTPEQVELIRQISEQAAFRALSEKLQEEQQ